jgi:hypothetical protein
MSTLFNIEGFRTKLRSYNPAVDAERIRTIFQEELFDWIDYFNENLKDDPSSKEARDARSSIIHLWIEYGTFEKSLKQFKKASQVYEDAIKEPISSLSSEIFIAYANYYTEREKPSSAKKTIIRGLCSKNIDVEDSDQLWLFFLNYMHKENNSTNLTIQQLHEAVKLQMTNVEGVLIAPSPGFLQKYGVNGLGRPEVEASYDSYSHAESKEESDLQVPEAYSYSEAKEYHDTGSAMDAPSASIIPPAIELDAQSIAYRALPTFDDQDDTAGLNPELLIRLHSDRPPILFSAPDKEPTSWGFAALTASDVQELEAFLGCPLAAISQPISQLNSRANVYLDVLESLWMLQALRERDFDAWFASLKESQSVASAALLQSLDIARATSVTELIAKAEADYHQHQNHCLVQREILHATINRAFHKLLIQQEECLLSIGFPQCTADIIKKIDEASIVAQNSASAISPYHRVPNLVEAIAKQSMMVCALLSTRLIPMMESSASMSAGSLLDSMDENAFDATSFRRMSSVESDRSGDWNQQHDHEHKRRKRRRGGVKNKNRQANAAGGLGLGGATEAHTAMAIPMFTVPDISSIAMQQQTSSSLWG